MTDTRTVKNFVGGEYADPADGRTYDLVNPATGEVFAQAPLSGEEDVDRAFRAAEKAFETWRDTTPSERQMAMLRIADAIEERAEELVRAESENTGKPFGLTMEEEIPQGLDQIPSSPAPQGSSRASRQASTWKDTRRSYDASR
jgi:betaine-aldehyde dehydrogenase